MRTLFFMVLCLPALFAAAQNGVTSTTFTVKGNCEDCKERIENAADMKGVKLLVWDPETKIAKVTFDNKKVSLLQIEQAIASKGYDAGPIKGNDLAYTKLPKCCQYRTNKCEDPGK